MFAVIKKEIKSYFYSPVGYVFIGLFLIMFSIFFYIDVFNYQSTNFEYIFYSGATILTFIVPILTMRTMAEERKTGTEQLLLTSPLSITKVVIGKFIAATLIVVITEIFTGIYFAILSFFGTPHITLYFFWNISIKYYRKPNYSRSNNNRIFHINMVFTTI